MADRPPARIGATVMKSRDFDPYAVLGVPPTATQAEITHAYRRQLRALHPDSRATGWASAADERLQRVVAAYALLRDPARRADHDREARHNHDVSPTRARPTSTAGSGAVVIPVSHGRSQFRSDGRRRPPSWAEPVRFR